jgi:pimeloyl-ACP methyl ester carboxylesterase
MRVVLKLILFAVLASGSVNAQVWTFLAPDTKGDGSDPSLPDAATLCYRYDKQQDMLWFRISLFGKPDDKAFGVNIAVDTGADAATKVNWWGANTSFKFDRLLTAWVTRIGDRYEGMMGVDDPPGVNQTPSHNAHRDNLEVRVEGDSIVIGVKRTDITDKLKMNIVAAVGSNQKWNDDIPNTGQAVIDLAAERPTRGLRELDVSSNNFTLPSNYKTLPDNKAPFITTVGHGRQTLVLVPGMYSGAGSFAGFIARNKSHYRIFVVTPPGVNGTPARPMPAPGTSFAEMTWTRRFEQDILDLIRRKKLAKPVIIAESHPASIAAMNLALDHPDELGGVIISGTNLLQFFPSPKDPTRKLSATPAERAMMVDESWADKWFKYVTAETWESNDMRPEMLASDAATGEKARQEIETAPLAIKIRYLCEFWASDVTRGFDKLQVPVLVLVAGFDEKFLSSPGNVFTKMAYVDSWETMVPKNPHLELVRIPNARLLILQDQPAAAGEAVVKFIQRVGKQ